MPTISVTVICKNEQENLKRLFPCLGFANEVVFVDTGSTDDSVETAASFGAKIYEFEWCDDFAKARNFAISKASCDYIMWVDCDDILSIRTQNLITEWKKNPVHSCADFYYMKYVVGDKFKTAFWRERLVRNCDKCRFVGFIHEVIPPFGQKRTFDGEVIHVSNADHSARNLAMYRKAQTKGKRFTARDKYYFARTLYDCGLCDEAMAMFDCASRCRSLSLTEVVDCKMHIAKMRLNLGENRRALDVALSAVRLLPPSPEVCCVVGDCFRQCQQMTTAVGWYLLATRAEYSGGFAYDYYRRYYPYMRLSEAFSFLGDDGQSAYYANCADLYVEKR